MHDLERFKRASKSSYNANPKKKREASKMPTEKTQKSVNRPLKTTIMSTEKNVY